MKLVFREHQPIANDVASFIFEPQEPLAWTAGQSIRLEIPAPDYGTNERRFTISAAPYEKVVAITTRRSNSEFKQSLWALQPGDTIEGYGIEGDFVWGEAVKQRVFVASGIGITPFYSMLKQRLHEGKTIPVQLLYGSAIAPFAKIFRDWQAEHPEFTLQLYDAPVTAQQITGHIAHEPALYLSGAESYVTALKNELAHHVATPTESIRTDKFTGNVLID